MVVDTFPEMTTETVHGEKFLLERAIETMESERRCVHPVHRHAFRQVSMFTSLFSGTTMKKCEGCQGRLRSLLSLERDDNAHQQVVKCVTCGVLAHRHCALSRTAPWQGSPCRGPEPATHKKRCRSGDQNDAAIVQPAFAAAAAVGGCYHFDERVVNQHEVKRTTTDKNIDEEFDEQHVAAPIRPPKSLFPFLSATSLLKSTRKLEICSETTGINDCYDSNDEMEYFQENSGEINDAQSPIFAALAEPTASSHNDLVTVDNQPNAVIEQYMKWTPQGPPPHWALAAANSDNDGFKMEEAKMNITEKTDGESSSALHFVNNSFSNVSRALHESIATPLLRRLSFESDYTRSETSSHSQIKGEEKSVDQVPAVEDANVDSIATSTGKYEKDATENEANSPMHFVHHSFATVSRVLQANIMASFQQKNVSNLENVPESVTPAEPEHEDELETAPDTIQPKSDDEVVKDSVTGIDPVPPKSTSPPSSTANDTCEAIKLTSADRVTRIRLATVAGGIAGGMAGLLIAGPAGAVIGAKCAQTAGVLGILLEGSVQIGVVVAGVAAAKYTAQQFQQMEEKRFLTIGEAGSQSEVLLVRPNVIVDPVWDEICAKARKSAPSQHVGGPHFLPFKLFTKAEGKEARLSKRERYHRDLDIVQTDEEEIPTGDKILLLVSRILNDKSSLPGYVYRYLVKEFKIRSQHDADLALNDKQNVQQPQEKVEMEKAIQNENCARARRQDAHAVIKHLTATLIDVRPAFASSPAITELTAAAVEALVFGELYDLVFEEIVSEEKAADQLLLEKIQEFESSLSNGVLQTKGSLSHLSEPAIQTLHLLPQVHSAVDKLRICVRFLECIAEHFSSSPSPEDHMGADSLLKMACQHIVVANVPNLNAEIAFLEEFARDETLLRGKEGYALVTLQASTHFLNLSVNLYNDIFTETVDVIEAT